MNISLLPPLSIRELGKRDNQEDNIYPALGKATEKDRIFVLCDGMGGHEHGEVASETVVEAISQYISSHWPADGIVPDTLITGAIDAAFLALDAKDNGEAKKMGTTLTLVVFHKGGCTAAHIGDSRIYHIRPSERKVLYRSRDHSLVFELYQAGEITYEQMATSPRRNIITRSMQPGEDNRCRPDIVHIGNLRAGDYFYMCSDGMLEQMEDDELVDLLAQDIPDEKKREQLIAATVGNHDNHSAHLIRLRGVARTEGETIADDEATTRCNALNVRPRTERTEEDAAANTRHPFVRQSVVTANRSGHGWLWLLLAAIAIAAAVACYYLFSRGNGSSEPQPEQPTQTIQPIKRQI